jgi:hypothetical protein
MTAIRRIPEFGLFSTFLLGVFVMAAAGVVGYFFYIKFPELLIQSILKYATGLVGLVWFFSLYVYNKLTDLTETSGLDHRQHLDVELEVRVRLHWFWWRAAILLCCSIIMNIPAIAVETRLSVGVLFYVAGFVALALAAFMLRRVWAELEDIRQFRSYVKRLDRENAALTAQAAGLTATKLTEWQPDPTLDGFRSKKTKKTKSSKIATSATKKTPPKK